MLVSRLGAGHSLETVMPILQMGKNATQTGEVTHSRHDSPHTYTLLIVEEVRIQGWSMPIANLQSDSRAYMASKGSASVARGWWRWAADPWQTQTRLSHTKDK